MERHLRLAQASREAMTSTSIIRRIFLLGQALRQTNQTADIIDLSLGNPDLEPPEAVIKALEVLTADRTPGRHRYMDNAGFESVRTAVAAHMAAEQGVPVAASSVYMTCGAAGGLHILMRMLLGPSDEVLLLAPFFVEYPTYLAVHNAVPVVVPLGQNLRPGQDTAVFVPRIEDVASRLTPRTRMIIINSPNNPSGCLYPREFLMDLAALIKNHEALGHRPIHVVSDEPYAHLVFAGTELPPVLACVPDAWIVRSHSKDLGLAGERIGFIAWSTASDDDKVLAAMRSAARALGFVNAPALMQRLLPHVLGAHVATDIYERRADVFCSILSRGGCAVERPGGTFFVLPRVPPGYGDDEFCEAAAARGILIVPAAAFGAPGYFRASLTQTDDRIARAAEVLVALAKAPPKNRS